MDLNVQKHEKNLGGQLQTVTRKIFSKHFWHKLNPQDFSCVIFKTKYILWWTFISIARKHVAKLEPFSI